jgi:thiamine biosynthesis protein ThiS
MSIQIVLNGETRTAPDGQTVAALLRDLDLDPARVAIEFDRKILRRANWAETKLAEGSRLEIVQFVGGG